MTGSLARRAAIVGILAGLAAAAKADFTTPWDALTNNAWIYPNTVRIYAANSAAEYLVGFSTRKNNGGARGTNSLRFNEAAAAHHQTSDLTGSFSVLASGNEDFTDLLTLVAIDSPSLPADFALTMGGYTFDPATDFCYYDGTDGGGTTYDTGRPTGYYDETDPTGEPIAYDFNAGMVTILALDGLTFDVNNPVDVQYAFENLPGRAVFSVYALPNGGTEIYHTNRGIEDLNDAGRGVSTFEVVPEPVSLALWAGGLAALIRRRR